MALYNSTTSNFEVVDRTNEILVLPQNWSLMNDSGMWNEEFLATRTVTFEEVSTTLFKSNSTSSEEFLVPHTGIIHQSPVLG